MQQEVAYIKNCIRQIEKKYHLTTGTGKWRQRDMEYLVRLIEEQSGVLLSLSTIKRILKNDQQVPQPATLNALASVLGYSNWQEFKMNNAQPLPAKRSKILVPLALGVVVLAAMAGLLVILGYGAGPGQGVPQVDGEVTFLANKTVLAGVPNTVIFTYDTDNIEADSFFIQQSWNELEKTPIDPEGTHFSSIYYYPGFHRAKFIANDSILKRKFIHITTEGWLPIIRKKMGDKIPKYVPRVFEEHESLGLAKEDLIPSLVDQGESFLLTYYNVKDFGGIHSDNFRLHTRLKLDPLNSGACPFMRVMVMTEQHIFLVRLITKGCEHMAELKIGEVYQGGRYNDLSALGVDVHQWQELSLEVVNKQAVLTLAGEPVREIGFFEDFGKVVGLAITFRGMGRVEYARITPLEMANSL
ncbi:MAG: hypothetical protein MJA30_10315 [Cytophagales bacterium]|nr:hypothetical protein [Cytophagales bacterium]